MCRGLELCARVFVCVEEVGNGLPTMVLGVGEMQKVQIKIIAYQTGNQARAHFVDMSCELFA